VPLTEAPEASIYKANVTFYTAGNWGLSDSHQCNVPRKQKEPVSVVLSIGWSESLRGVCIGSASYGAPSSGLPAPSCSRWSVIYCTSVKVWALPARTNGLKIACSPASCLAHYTIPFLTLDGEGRGNSKKSEEKKWYFSSGCTWMKTSTFFILSFKVIFYL